MTVFSQAIQRTKRLKAAEKVLPPPKRSTRENLCTKNQLKAYYGILFIVKKIMLYFCRCVEKKLRPVHWESVFTPNFIDRFCG